MKIAVTGASGLVGAAVAARLRREHEVVTLGRRAGADRHLDLADRASIAALDLAGCEALVHCAGIIDEDFREDPARAFLQATLGAAALVSRALAGGARHLVYVSSAHVYGPFVGRIDEASPVNPLTDYAIAHFATEQTFRRAATGAVRGAAFRPCAVFGMLPDVARFRRWSLVPFGFPRAAVTDGAIVLQSTGEQRRNFVAASDIADSIALWLAEAEAPPAWSVVNPVGRETLSVHAFALRCAALAERVSGRPCEVRRVEPTGRTAGDDFEYGARDPRHRGTADLDAVLLQLIRQLSKHTTGNGER